MGSHIVLYREAFTFGCAHPIVGIDAEMGFHKAFESVATPVHLTSPQIRSQPRSTAL